MPGTVKVLNRGPAPLSIDGMLLEVGATHVPADRLAAALNANPKARKVFEHSCVLFTEQPEGVVDEVPAYVPSLVTLSTRAAKDAIDSCTDPAQLRIWISDDARATVQKHLHLRYRTLAPAPAEAGPDIQVG